MKFSETRKVSFDTETTGPEPVEDRIVTAALVVRGGGRPNQKFTWLINPGVEIPQGAIDMHGVTNERAQTWGQDPKVALDEIADKLVSALTWGMPVIAFNLYFDWTILDRDLRRHDLPPIADRIGDITPALVDPHVLDKQLDRFVKGSGMRKLKPTADRYGIQLDDWHTAEADALAALLIAEAQFERYPQLNDYSLADLYAAQQRWRAGQQAGLQDWFRTKPGRENETVDGNWPLVPFGGDQ